MLRFLIIADHWYGGRDWHKDIRCANRSSSTEVEHRQPDSHDEAGETNKARDDNDGPLQERRGDRSHFRILVEVNLTSVGTSQQCLSSVDDILVQQAVSASKVFNKVILMPLYLRRAEATNSAFRERA